jgi:small subunit ribosomal protein S13
MGSTKIRPTEEKEEKPKEKKAAKPVKIEKQQEEARALVRVAATDLDGEKSVVNALKGIKGISQMMSNAVCTVSGIDCNRKLGSLSEADIQKLEEIINDPMKFGVPNWAVNRRRDMMTGADMHLTGPDLDMATRFDVQRMVDMKSYKGVRHMLGLPVRGQRTRSSFRKGKVVGVIRKTIRMQMEKEGKEKKTEGKK